MKTPVALLKNYLQDIETQLIICKENRTDVEAVELEALRYQNAIKVLEQFGLTEKDLKAAQKKQAALRRRRYIMFRKKPQCTNIEE